MDDVDNPVDFMDDVIEPDDFGDTEDTKPGPQVIEIKGEQYELASYGEKFGDGSRQATLRLIVPF